jgi:hypothetical protein
MVSIPASDRKRRQRGATAPEFAIVAVIFFAMLFGTIEVARALYLWSTLAEVVGRAARIASLTARATKRWRASKRCSATPAASCRSAGAFDATYLRIDYLASDRRTTVAAPPCPQQNIINCINDATGPTCVRYVRARLCMPGSNCTQVTFNPIVGLDAVQALRMSIPTFETVAAAESLGLPAACN